MKTRDRGSSLHLFGCMLVEKLKRGDNVSAAAFHNAAVRNHLVNQEMDLIKVEHDVQLTHSSKVLVHCLHHEVDDL